MNDLTIIWDDSFTSALPADPSDTNIPRQVKNASYSYVHPTPCSNPSLIASSVEMVRAIGLNESDVDQDSFVQLFAGNSVPADIRPYAMCYGGHQFGHWAGQLGDGRAINLGEVVHEGQRWAIQLKGVGRTPYSRTADGLAVLRSSIREFLCSEAMHHLGIPTTRALSLIRSGDQVLRDMMYDGNAAYEPGAIVCRVAPSFIRFGSFQIHTARQEVDILQRLADYVIAHFYRDISSTGPTKYVDFYKAVVDRTLDMIIHWQRVGFVHGVMNTDNFSILGQTIDYGPYGWLEPFEMNWTPNTTDAQSRRYTYGKQPEIGLWNCMQLANALFPLVKEAKPFEEVIEYFKERYYRDYASMFRNKLGLLDPQGDDHKLINQLLTLLPKAEVDMTIFFRQLMEYHSKPLDYNQDKNRLSPIRSAFYNLNDLNGSIGEEWIDWVRSYQERIQIESQPSDYRIARMRSHNPKYVLRNYMAQLAIEKAEQGDYQLIYDFQQLLRNPYDEQPAFQAWYAKRPEWARNKVGCSALSCSS